MSDTLRILVIGAHPDDCDYHFGGCAAKYVRLGHRVKFVSLTNGDGGHYFEGGGPLARRRYQEAQRVAELAGIEYQILDNHDAELMPTLENRWAVVNIIREYEPDLVVTNRPNDYHPDHRYTAQLVQDAAYTVTIPNVQALTPHLKYNPVIAYWNDDFMRPYPHTPDVAVDVDDVAEVKIDMLDCHESQFYEWLPYNHGTLDTLPEDRQARRQWMAAQRLGRMAREADRCRELLKRLYGEERGAQVRYCESFELGEYGGRVTQDGLWRLFPFFDR
jgi:LmbE family N-acetylglucosaminyl deacetylase